MRGRINDAGTASYDTYQATYVERGANDEYRLWKAVNGAFTLLASTTTGPNMQAGDQLGLKTQGSTISLWRQPAGGAWTQLLTATDTSITTAGLAGMQMRGPNGRADDFTVASDFTATAASTVSYGFDPAGFRHSRTANSATTRYLLGGLIETTAAGAVTLFDVDGPLGDLAHYTSAPTTGQTAVTFPAYNGHGDLAAEASPTGVRTAAFTYDPFGAPLETPPADSTTERFTGQWDKKHDTTTGLIEMGARPYDPAIGRFYAVDPVEGGSANHYDYAGQDPVNAYDLDGNCPSCFVNAAKALARGGRSVARPVARVVSKLRATPNYRNPRVTISAQGPVSHGARHLPAGLSRADVETAIQSQVRQIASTFEVRGPFYGRVTVDGSRFIYRAFPLPGRRINIGTYYPG